MAASATLRDPLLPRQPGGMAGGAALAIGVHVALVAALAAAVNWRTQAVEVVASAELWSAVPQVAAPPAAAPPPAPPPPAQAPAPAPVAATPAPAPAPAPAVAAPEQPRAKPDIAIEREREKAREKERARREALEARETLAAREAAAAKAKAKAADAAKSKADAAKATAAEEARLAAQRTENLRRMMEKAGGATPSTPTSTGSAARDAAPSTAYIGRLVATIRTNIVFTADPPGNPTAEVEVRAGPSGTILSRRLVKPSGVAEWDEAVLRAIDRTATLPRDTDGRVPQVLLIAFRLRE